MNKLNLLLVGLVAWSMSACQVASKSGSVTGATSNPRQFGALGDGKHLDSPAINQAIEAVAAAGGGTVNIPAGTYLSGSIHMKSNINLHLDAGCILLGAPLTMDAYDHAEEFKGQAYQDAGHTYFHNSLIWGENLVNVSITGQGMINGGDMVRTDGRLDQRDGFAQSERASNPNFGGGPYPAQANGQPSTRAARGPEDPANKSIALKLCKNVLIRDITIFHGGHFAILVTGCDEMTVDNVTMDTNRDGIDIDCCRNTVVSNCRINSPNDDGLCPKSSFALGENRITENLTITNCQVSGFEEGTLIDGRMLPSRGKTGRIKMGTEANGGFRNITISNCTFRSCRGLALEEVDGGILENITISNISMMDVSGYPIYITTGSRNRGPAVKAPSIMRNILISNVVATNVDALSGIQIMGLPEQPIEGVRLDNIRISYLGGGTAAQANHIPTELGKIYPEPGRLGVMPAYGIFARHVKGLELANMNFTYQKEDLRPAMMCVDVDGLEIDNFKANVANGVKAARLEVVKNETIRNSPVLQADANVDRKAEMTPYSPPEPRQQRGQ